MVVPVGTPQDTEFGAYFGGLMLRERGPLYQVDVPRMVAFSRARPVACQASPVLFQRDESTATDDLLVQLAGRIEPDGGMPGKDDEERWVATATALLCFLVEGHTPKSGAFRVHVKKLLAFLQVAPSTATDERKRRLIEQAQLGIAPTGDWMKKARTLVEGKPVAAREFWQAAIKELTTAVKTKNSKREN